MKQNEKGEGFIRSEQEESSLDKLKDIHLNLVPKLGENWNQHSLVTLRRQSISRILYYDWVYKKLLGKPGVICEFGVQWGSGLSVLQSLRGMYEPYNHQRKLIGFDTFEGFPDVCELDAEAKVGDYATDVGYEHILQNILDAHEQQSPLSHIKKNELVKGDASETVKTWLEQHPGLLIGMAIFDMDIYKPTRDVLEAIKPRLFKGSVLVFDELSCDSWPGETIAVQEVLGINSLRFEHFPHQPNCAVAIYE
ncbi:crotonobetainyl-CoA--carnitine CoA-transferase [Photobacterium sp. BZF1]|uniref:TylF/MycF/NovP-related O-methyltransferase n=1 Tax=Photobacterium sp. BZF1 TaxID=1904457 RepID=UPI0016535109|nr:TylF/MycF/NovP-related O-methyltransferase [Photobacterium sp. BZF1]MBC7002015.1 crotonobetainyl-CoA--carnitine CoA-transferase [Photobacterium sp. BZF1]